MKKQEEQKAKELEEKVNTEQKELQKKLMEEFEASGDEIARIVIKRSKHSENECIGAILMKKDCGVIQALSDVFEENLGFTIVPSELISAIAGIVGASIVGGLFFEKEKEEPEDSGGLTS